MCFRKKQKVSEDIVEQKFDAMMNLIKDLPRADYNRLKRAMDLGYDSYQAVRNVKTVDEKENEDIDDTENKLKFIEAKEK